MLKKSHKMVASVVAVILAFMMVASMILPAFM